MRPTGILFSIQLLKIQEPCPPFHMVSLLMSASSPSEGYLSTSVARAQSSDLLEAAQEELVLLPSPFKGSCNCRADVASQSVK